MTKPTKIKGEDIELEDKDYALVESIKELTNELRRANTK